MVEFLNQIMPNVMGKLPELWKCTGQTLSMMLYSGIISFVIGIVLGVVLTVTKREAFFRIRSYTVFWTDHQYFQVYSFCDPDGSAASFYQSFSGNSDRNQRSHGAAGIWNSSLLYQTGGDSVGRIRSGPDRSSPGHGKQSL